MTKRKLSTALLTLLMLVTVRAADKPNVVFFLIDDLSWADLACYGSEFHETPNLDRLAKQGLRFTDAYASCPVCSPTRASVMTGKYPARLGITDWIGAGQKRLALVTPPNEAFLPPSEVTIGEAMQQAGYKTAYFGKWHLGKQDAHHPEKQGFGYHRGVNRAGQPGSYFHPFSRGKKGDSSVPDFDAAGEGSYLTDLIADEAVKFVESNKDKPFFAMVAHYSIHTPIQAKKEDTEKYQKKLAARGRETAAEFRDEKGFGRTRLNQNNAALAAMVGSVDASVGRMLDKLDELGLSDKTMIIFTSDNGGLSTLQGKRVGPGCNLPLRAGKGWMYEGGIRVPLIIKLPGVTKPGSTCSVPVVSTDFYPTLLDVAGLEARPEQHLDGVSLAGLLKGETSLEREAIFWHYPHYHGSGNRPTAAVRKGDWKLVRYYETGEEELYHLKDDLGEAKDLAGEDSAKHRELKVSLDGWLKGVGAKMAQKP
ncbi:MAG: arylsulfatase A-like enzyme [Verrucomicrobiales bacterium]|jgi:arylsulfatase A-like enzyme